MGVLLLRRGEGKGRAPSYCWTRAPQNLATPLLVGRRLSIGAINKMSSAYRNNVLQAYQIYWTTDDWWRVIDWWVVSDIDYVLQHNARCMIIIGLWGLINAYSRSLLTCTRRIHRPLVFYTKQLQNPNPKPGFEGVQTRNPGLKVVVLVWNPVAMAFELHFPCVVMRRSGISFAQAQEVSCGMLLCFRRSLNISRTYWKF